MSKVQFNLLPDAKVAHNRALAESRRLGQITRFAAVFSVSLFLLLLLTVYVLQKKQLSDSASQLTAASKQLKTIPQIDNILTVQNQLQTLTGLHQKKHVTSRIFTYLPQLTPADVTIDKLDVDLTQNTMIISGKASSQHGVNTFVDTIKLAALKINSGDTPTPAFSAVVESGFTISSGSIGYTINLQFDPRLFANNLIGSSGKPQTPQLIVKKSSSGTVDPSTTLFNSTRVPVGQ